MARIVKDDYDNLLDFVKSYSLSGNLTEKTFLQFLSGLHKKYYSYLVLMEEYRQFVDNTSMSPTLSKTQFEYLQESVSDCGQAFFLAMNGCYKGARLLLRSSIETFIRAISIDEIPGIESETSVYEVFKLVSGVRIFTENVELKDTIHDEYKNLCQDVHTAGSAHMAGVTALKFFPHFEYDDAQDFERSYLRLLSCYITIIGLKYNVHYHKMHYSNKDIVINEILKDYRGIIYGIKD